VFLRLAVTFGLLSALAMRMDLARAEQVLSRLSLPLLAGALAALFIAAVPVNALRWSVILAAGRGPVPGTRSLMKLLLVGLFFNQVLPTGVGGDAVRAWRCRKLGIGLGAAVRSVLLDRASGYLVMVVIYALALPVLLRSFPDVRERAGLAAVLGGALCGFLALTLMDRLPTPLLRLPMVPALGDLSGELRRLLVDPSRCGIVLGLSVLTIGFSVLAYMLTGESLGVDLSFETWLLVVPPLAFIQLLPISLAGWGVREAGLVFILAGFGIPAEAALATSLLMGLSLIIVGLPGGLIWLFGWDIAQPSPVAARASLPDSGSTRRGGPP